MTSNKATGFTMEKLVALEEAIADGVREVKYSDKVLVYNSLEDMLKARDLLRKKLGLCNTSGKKGLFGGKRINAVHSKGLDDC